jgi:predicted Zn-dependent protease
MSFLGRPIRRWKRRFSWLRDWWPTWYETWGPVRRGWRYTRHLLKEWYAGRDFRRFWISLPALLAGLLWLVFAALLLAWTPGRITSQYTRAAQRARDSRRYEQACLAYERLMQTDRKLEPAHVYGLALSLQGMGKTDEAAALLSTIAPLDAAGHAPAHLLLAKSILANPRRDPGWATQAESHLNWVLMAEPQNGEAQLLLGTLYAESGRWAEAREYLLKAYAARNEVALVLARVAAAQGDEAAAHNWAEKAQATFKAEAKANPGATAARIRWAEATMLLDQFAAALEILNPGLAQADNRIYRDMGSRICEQWLNKTIRVSPNDWGLRLSLVARGLEYAPNNQALIMHLIALTHLSGKEADQARDRLNALLTAGGQNSALLHFCLGADGWARGHPEEARQHFIMAYELAPQMPYIANNMAMMLSLSDPPDLPRALAIVQFLADKFPNDPHVLDTRGQILVKMGKWQEGVKCLELALPALTSKTMTHKALAEAYQHLGFKDLAEQHQRLARGT